MNLSRVLFPIAGVFVLLPFVTAADALVLGIFLSVTIGNPYVERTRPWVHELLTLSVMGLGAGMDLRVIGRVGLHGIGYTIAGISFALLMGSLFGKLFKVESDVSLLITSGTAICGGSAIAAVAPTIGAKSRDVSVALGIVFLLNALALLIFPPIGHALGLGQTQFGLWSALAIHDTSSVVGAGLQYGAEALQVGTTVKLARALWIVPLTLAIGALYSRRNPPEKALQKPKRPWFILGFIAAAALVTWVPALQGAGHVVSLAAQRLLVLTLFLIGSNLNRETLKSVGFRPFAMGVALWITVACATLGSIELGWIH